MANEKISREECNERARLVVARERSINQSKVKLSSTLKKDLLYQDALEIGALKPRLDLDMRGFECDTILSILKTRTTVNGVGYAAWLGINSKYKKK